MVEIGSGQLVGWVDRVSNMNDSVPTNSAPNNNQAMFTIAWQFFNGPMLSSSYSELVALQYGNSGVSYDGNGTNFFDETDSFGDNAFFVFKIPSASNAGGHSKRSHDYYVLMQWADASSFGSSPGNPGEIIGAVADGFGISVAWRHDGGNPWGGSTNADGTDTKSDPVWADGGSAVTVFPKSNNAGYSNATSKENCARIDDISTSYNDHRIHWMGDRDRIWMVIDNADSSSPNNFVYIGIYEPFIELTGSIDTPFMMFTNDGAVSIVQNTSYGSDAGTSAIEGLIHGPTASVTNSANGLRMERHDLMMANTVFHPNPMASDTFGAYPPMFMVYDNPDYSPVGTCKGMSEVFNVVNNSINAASSSVVFGNTNPKFLLPWSGSHPRSSFDRAGRHFEL